jgi:hypothetical protein
MENILSLYIKKFMYKKVVAKRDPTVAGRQLQPAVLSSGFFLRVFLKKNRNHHT